MKYLAALLTLFTFSLIAQTNATDAALDGYVTDPSGGAVPNALVSATSPATNQVWESRTDGAGYYRFPLLRIGKYNLRAQASNFALYLQEGISLSVGRQVRINISLSLAATTEAVRVTADASPIDIGAYGTGETVDEPLVRNLPIPSRNVYNLHLLGPGVKGQPSSNFATTLFYTGGLTRTSWSVDGIDSTSRRNDRQIRMGVLTPEGIEQMQLLSGGYSAEFGRAAGSVISVITRGGTNEFHGGGMFLYRPNSWSARPALAASRVDQSWWLGAGNLGGPILRNKLWFFANTEYNPYQEPSPVTITPANAQALGLSSFDTSPAQYGEKYFNPSGKMNFQLNPKNSGFLRYSHFSNSQPIGRAGLTIPSRTTNYNDKQHTGAGQWTSILSPRLLSESRFAINRRLEDRQPVGQSGPDGALVNIQGVANIGVNPFGGSTGIETASTLSQNLTYSRGRHTMKSGLEYQTVNLDVTNSLDRVFAFNGLAASAARPAVSPLNQYLRTLTQEIDPATNRPYTYTQLTQQVGDPALALRFHFLSWFAQDEFRVSPRLMLNFGLRHEMLFFPTMDNQAPNPLSRELRDSLGNFAPRFGFSYQPFQNSRTVIRGSFGLFYDTPALNLLINGALNNGRRVTTYQIPGTNALAPTFPNLFRGNAANLTVAPSITAFSRDYRLMYGQNANFIVEQEILANTTLSLQYTFWTHRHGLYTRDTNLGDPIRFLADGRPVYRGTQGRPDTRFAAINLLESGANTNSNALDLTLRRRFHRGLQFSATYSWSHSLGESEMTGGALANPLDRRYDYGNLNGDLRHNLNYAITYAPKFFYGFELSSLGFWNSGYPIDVRAGVDLNADLILNDRNVGVSRNSLTGPRLLQIDFRLTRRFRFADKHTLELIAESDNLLNSLNANCSAGCTGAVVNREGALDFGRITSARTNRRIQFGFRYAF